MYTKIYGILIISIEFLIIKGFLAPLEEPNCTASLAASGQSAGCGNTQTEMNIFKPNNYYTLCRVDVVNRAISQTSDTIEFVVYESATSDPTGSYNL